MALIIEKRTSAKNMIIAFLAGICTSFVFNAIAHMNQLQARSIYQLLYASCAPVMLIGLYLFKVIRKIMESLGWVVCGLSVFLFGMVSNFFTN